MSDSTCKICGGPVPSGLRYCNDCDFQQRSNDSDSRSNSEHARQTRPQAERGSLSVRIRADRNTDSEIVGMLEVGETVRAHFLEDNWYAVFDSDAPSEDPSAAIGYVYAPLLIPAPGETMVSSS